MSFKIDNLLVNAEPLEVVTKLKFAVANKGKLSVVRETSSGIQVTCPCANHSSGRESTPSCYVNPETGLYHCFTCDKAGPIQDFAKEALELPEDRVIDWFKTNFNCITTASSVKLSDAINLRSKLFGNAGKLYLDKSELDKYQNWCPYFQTRGLTRATCMEYNLKYDPEKNNVIFPCYDANGNLLMTPTRNIYNKIFYLNTDMEKPVYCLDRVIKNKKRKIIVTEGPFDALLANQYGAVAVATLGAIDDSQIKKINESGVISVYAMFDNDAAGRKFTEKLKAGLDKRIMFTDVRIPNGHKDIGELSYEEFWNILSKY